MNGDRVADLLAELAHQHDRTTDPQPNPRVVVEIADAPGESYFPITGVSLLDDGTLAVQVKIPLHAATVEVMNGHWPDSTGVFRSCSCGWRWTPGCDFTTHVATELLIRMEKHCGR